MRYPYNLGQNIVNKYTKLTKLGFTTECFSHDFLQFPGTIVKIWLLGYRLVTCDKLQAFQGFFRNFLISLRS